MRRTAFIILGATAAVVALLLVGAAIAIKTLDPNRFVAPLAARVKAATGRELSVHGPIEYKLSLTPKVVLPDVTIGALAKRSAEENFTVVRGTLDCLSVKRRLAITSSAIGLLRNFDGLPRKITLL